jgi:hypothetical protein
MTKLERSRQTVENGDEIFVALRCINKGISGVDWGDGWVSVPAEHEDVLKAVIDNIDDPYGEFQKK